MTSLIISIDIGTTSTKATIFTTAGQALQSFYQGYDMTKKADGTATQDPDVIFQAVLTTLKKALHATPNTPEQTLAVTFSSAMHSLIALDNDNQLLTPVITWADSRSTAEAEQLKNSLEGPLFYQKTGTPLHPMTPLAKILWLQKAKPALYQQVALFTSIKEYIFFRLFGVHVVDYSIASGTGLFNVHTLKWDADILAYLNLTESQLPKAVPPTEQLRGLQTDVQTELGLTTTIPFIIGASDGALANLGTNCLTPDVANLTIGTSAALRLTVREPLLHPQGKSFCYLLDEGYWVIGGAANNGGMIIDWACQTLATPALTYDQFMGLVASVEPGAANLFFHPYLTGERAPLWDGNVRGSFSGLALAHTPAHLLRAVLEGICFNITDIYQSLGELLPLPTRIMASGGFSHSETWKQLMTDMLGQPITFPDTHESSGLGAMILALKSLGLIANLAESSALPVFNQPEQRKQTQPNKETQKLYQQQFNKFQALQALHKKQTDILQLP